LGNADRVMDIWTKSLTSAYKVKRSQGEKDCKSDEEGPNDSEVYVNLSVFPLISGFCWGSEGTIYRSFLVRRSVNLTEAYVIFIFTMAIDMIFNRHDV
jgi:hypothetical protein